MNIGCFGSSILYVDFVIVGNYVLFVFVLIILAVMAGEHFQMGRRRISCFWVIFGGGGDILGRPRFPQIFRAASSKLKLILWVQCQILFFMGNSGGQGQRANAQFYHHHYIFIHIWGNMSCVSKWNISTFLREEEKKKEEFVLLLSLWYHIWFW